MSTESESAESMEVVRSVTAYGTASCCGLRVVTKLRLSSGSSRLIRNRRGVRKFVAAAAVVPQVCHERVLKLLVE